MNRAHISLPIGIALIWLSSGAAGQVISFETKPNGAAPTDDETLDRTTPYQVDGIEVLIGFDEDRNGTVETDGVFEAVGEDGTDGFTNNSLGGNDVSDPGFEQQLGLWFLRSPNSGGGGGEDPGILVLAYSEPVTAMSGEIWDLDGGSGGTEAWIIRARDGTGSVVASLRSPEFGGHGATSFDGEPWIFSVFVPDGFVRIEIEFDGTKTEGIGLAFNNYSATTAVSGPRLLTHDPSTPNGVFHSPGGTNTVRLIWSEAVSIDETDVAITDSLSQPVSFTLSGSGTQVTHVDLDQPFTGDTYTFTIHDTAVATANNAPIDGDDDGLAGGDATFTLTHCCPTDLDCDGETGLSDLAILLAAYDMACN